MLGVTAGSAAFFLLVVAGFFSFAAGFAGFFSVGFFLAGFFSAAGFFAAGFFSAG